MMYLSKRTETRSRLLTWLAFLGYLAFVVYGSLVPFELRPMSWEQAITGFQQIRHLNLGVASRADWVANIVLYIPLAFLGCAAVLGVRRASWLAPLGALLVAVFCLAVAIAVEFSQQWFAPRTVSSNDLLAESIGTLIGVLAWGFGRQRISLLQDSAAQGGRASVLAALWAYAAIYGLMSLFPYDFLVSMDELRARLAANPFDWLLSGNCGGSIRCAAHLGVEVLAIAPLGLFAILVWPRVSLQRLFAVGVAVGLVLEPLQLLIASGTSQGVSVLLRGVGLVLGGLAGQQFGRLGPRPVARAMVVAAAVLMLPYLAGLALVSGWFAGSAVGLDAALASLHEVRWLPLYYHYFTTESDAMVSALAQFALYAPVGLGVWALAVGRGGRRVGGPWAAAGLALAVAGVIESGKLFFPPNHPDPTNLLIAAIAALAAFGFARWFERVLTGGPAGTLASPERNRQDGALNPLAAVGGLLARGSVPGSIAGMLDRPPSSVPGREALGMAIGSGVTTERDQLPFAPLRVWPAPRPRGLALAVLAGLCCCVGVAAFPIAWPILATALLLYGALLWYYPLAWLLVLPALLPVLDLSLLTGRLPLDAFDLLLLTTLTVCYIRVWGVHRRPWPNRLFQFALILLWLSWAISMSRGLWPLLGSAWPPAASAHSPVEAWMVGKGMFWALLLIPLLRRVPRGQRPRAQRLFLSGTAAGLAMLVLAVIWERQVFVGLLDFAAPFRVTGTFTSLATGGAYIEGYLVFCLPLVLAWALIQRHWGATLMAVLLGVGGLYALYVTYARGGYLGLGVGLLTLALGLSRLRSLPLGARGGAALGTLLLVGIGAWAVLAGGTATERLKGSYADLRARAAHWQRAVTFMSPAPGAYLVGAGFGQYPMSALLLGAMVPPPGTFAVLREGEERFLRLGSGQGFYLDQPVAVIPDHRYRLSVRLRAPVTAGELKIALCEKALLDSFGCQWFSIRAVGAAAGWGETQQFEVNSGGLGGGGGWPHRTVKVSLHNPGAAPIDIKEVSLRDTGRELIANGNFDQGAARWLASADQKEAWHIDQLWVETFFAQGLLGVLALGLLLLALGRRLWPGLLVGDPWAIGFCAAFAGLLTVGMTGSLLDAAPTAMLFWFGAFAAAFLASPRRPDA